MISDKGCHRNLQALPLYFLDEKPLSISPPPTARILNLSTSDNFLPILGLIHLWSSLPDLSLKCSPFSWALKAWSPAGRDILKATEFSGGAIGLEEVSQPEALKAILTPSSSLHSRLLGRCGILCSVQFPVPLNSSVPSPPWRADLDGPFQTVSLINLFSFNISCQISCN